jgi:hypothetical protein
MKKLFLALAVLCLPASAQACPPQAMFGGFNGFNFCPQMSLMAVDVPVVELVPQIRFQRQFVAQQSFVMPICPQSFGFGNSFISAQNFGYGNSFGRGLEFGGRNSFVGRGFEFQGSENPRRLSIRENPRGGVRIRERGGR